MTTPPKGRLFRVNARSEVRPKPKDLGDMPFACGQEDGFGDQVLKLQNPIRPGRGKPAAPTPKNGKQSSAITASSDVTSTKMGNTENPSFEERIAAVKAEPLTPWQLRRARRVADFHKIDAPSVYEAIIRLRDAGVDPFDKKTLSALREQVFKEVAAQQNRPAPNTPAPTRQHLPAEQKAAALPSREQLTEERRIREIRAIQRDIARRRRRRLGMLLARLTAFVFLPTLIAGYYYSFVATPLYATNSSFQITQADAFGGKGGGAASALAGRMASPDSVMVQEYLTSLDALVQIDHDLGFKKIYESKDIDPIQRLPENSTNAEAYKLYRKTVKIGYDPTDGILKMEVSAPTPELSMTFANTLLGYAEKQIDQLTQRVREDQMKGARETYKDAESKVLSAQKRMQDLQAQMGMLDPKTESSMVMGRVQNLESQLAKKNLELGQLLDNAAPNRSRVDGVRGDIRRLEAMIKEERERLTMASQNQASLADVIGQVRIAESDLETRQKLLAAAAEQMEIARIEANKQVRYLLIGVKPVLPDEAAYPKVFMNTLVAFLIFSGIYLMLSLTASILREQVSS